MKQKKELLKIILLIIFVNIKTDVALVKENKIIARVDNQIISSYELKNKIKTILFFVFATTSVLIFKKIIKKIIFSNSFFCLIYLLNDGAIISPNGVKVILNISEFSASNSESL